MPYPLWDGKEIVQDHAQRAGLEPTRRLNCGNGVMLDLVLVPAGRFVMGTPEPVPPDEDGLKGHILVGQVVVCASAFAAVAGCVAVVVAAVRRRRKPQYSLGQFVVFIWICSVAAFGGSHWYTWWRKLDAVRSAYAAACGRFEVSDPCERPAHEVTIGTPFYMGKYEVTQAQFEQVMGYNESHHVGAENPVEGVEKRAMLEFCKRMSSSSGQRVRLPSEAEWEYACRAGTETNYYSGDAEPDLARAAWYSHNSGGQTHPVGQKEPNWFGLYDMHGNVVEVVLDVYYDTYSGAPADARPRLEPNECGWDVQRGGDVMSREQCRSADRGSGTIAANGVTGFRVVCELGTRGAVSAGRP